MQLPGSCVAVIGAGAVGSILSARFGRAGYPTLLVEPGMRFEQVRDHGVRLDGTGPSETRPTALLRSARELARFAPDIGACFVCTKTWALPEVLPQLRVALGPNAWLVSFQNGIGPEDTMVQFFSPHRVARAVVNFAGSIHADTGVVSMHWLRAPNFIGSRGGNPGLAAALAKTLSEVGLATEAVSGDEIQKKVFFKAILSSALGALCASTGVSMAQAMSYPHTRILARSTLQEGLCVARALGYDYGPDALDVCLRYLEAGGPHLPSMWSDLQHGRRTEVEAINGRIVELGQMFGDIDVSANRFLASMIITLEIQAGARAPDQIPPYLARRLAASGGCGKTRQAG